MHTRHCYQTPVSKVSTKKLGPVLVFLSLKVSIINRKFFFFFWIDMKNWISNPIPKIQFKFWIANQNPILQTGLQSG